MKKYIIKFSITCLILPFLSCDEIERVPLDVPTSETFYSNQLQMETAANGLYVGSFLNTDNEKWTDNEWNRGGGTEASFLSGINTSQSGVFTSAWSNSYRAIARANRILDNIDNPMDYSPGIKDRIIGEAKFIRAYNYALLALRFERVPIYDYTVSPEEALVAAQSEKEDVLEFVFMDLDDAISKLPWSYGKEARRFTKGAALAIKARISLYTGRYQQAVDAAKQIMDSGTYSLHPSYRELFLQEGESSNELILSVPRDISFDVSVAIRTLASRNAGGWSSHVPTLALLDSYECTDGLPIHESPLYDLNNPFQNRDPRLKASIVTPGDEWLGFIYDSRPSATKVLNLTTNKEIQNKDSQSGAKFASYVGVNRKKGIPNDPDINVAQQDLDRIIIRYAEVLLIYAEAKIELNEIDQSVLDAMNAIRARAYGVAVGDVASYPILATLNQGELRRYLRRERRVEFAFEGLRYRDILRWRIAGKVFNRTWYGYPNEETQGWPIFGLPDFDENDIPDYSKFDADLRNIAETAFDESKHYLWAIPFEEFDVRPLGDWKQNEGY